ncbi:hypothetical protein [Arenimonas alkanexedens]
MRDPVAEAQAAETQGQRVANQELAVKRKRQKRSSLLTMGAAGYTGPAGASMLASAAPGGG